jgi:signal transduction histidine kinase
MAGDSMPQPDAAMVNAEETDRIFAGSGEMRELCRALDWGSTPFGPVEEWSQSLRTTVRTLLASRNPMFLWWGPDLGQIYNDAYRPSLGEGGRHPRALGARGREFWTDIWETIGPEIEHVMTTGGATWHEDQYLPIERNGRLDEVWWTYSYSPVWDDDGTIGGTLVVCQETTARVRALQAARESEARYRSLFDALDEGFCVIEVIFDGDEPVDYRFIEANPAFVDETGLTDAIGRRVRELVPGHEKHWFETYGRVAKTGEALRFDAPARALNRWYDVYAFRTGRPEERKVAVLFRDVSDARAAEAERDRLLEALSLERSRLAEIFRRSPNFLAVLRGPEHVFELVNDAYYGIVGNRSLIGRPVLEALPELEDQPFLALLNQVLETGEPYVGREVAVQLARSPDAPTEERFVDFVYQPLIEADGSRSGVISHGSDVTEQVLARREVERLLAESEAARGEAEAANRAKSEFLAVMSHELRTPLNAIGGYAELLEMGIHGPLSARQLEALRRIQASQIHLLGLINEVLNYAKLETGTVYYEVEEVPVREVLAAAESLVAPLARAKRLKLSIEPCAPALSVRADAEKLRQILVNLLGNAVKFTPSGEGGVGGQVTVTAGPEGRRVAIRVNDTGIGIPAEKLESIFDPFVQVRTDLTRPNEGTGLGLAISRDLARGMGGDLVAESTPGVGSTFTLTLPAA